MEPDKMGPDKASQREEQLRYYRELQALATEACTALKEGLAKGMSLEQIFQQPPFEYVTRQRTWTTFTSIYDASSNLISTVYEDVDSDLE